MSETYEEPSTSSGQPEEVKIPWNLEPFFAFHSKADKNERKNERERMFFM